MLTSPPVGRGAGTEVPTALAHTHSHCQDDHRRERGFFFGTGRAHLLPAACFDGPRILQPSVSANCGRCKTFESELLAALRRWGMVIVDESSRMRTSKFGEHKTSKETLACHTVIAHSKRALLLSGTPTESRPYELWHQVDALTSHWPKDRRPLGTFKAFRCVCVPVVSMSCKHNNVATLICNVRRYEQEQLQPRRGAQ